MIWTIQSQWFFGTASITYAMYVKLISKPRLPLSNDYTQVTKESKTLMFILY